MSAQAGIEWTDTTWNPVRGCARVSAGCEHCYAERQAHRFSGPGQPYDGLTIAGPKGPRWTGQVRLVPEALDAPLRWRKPSRIFVNSMSDLFHEDVPDGFIRAVWATMQKAKRHTFQVLTKRPERMRALLTQWEAEGFRVSCDRIWLGVSVENQAAADERIPLLLQTPAAVRFVSCEPLLGPVRLDKIRDDEVGALWNSLKMEPACGIGWVIVGGESGPGARTVDVRWIRSIVEQCRSASVPCFTKQLGAACYESDGGAILGHSIRIDDDDPCQYQQLDDRKGGDPSEWPEDLRVREFPR